MKWLWNDLSMDKRDPKRKKAKGSERFPNYERVRIATLKKSRKGKHHDLIQSIMEDLRRVESGFAVKIPLASVDGVSVINLRSAITRSATKEGFAIGTSADDTDFYVWKV